MTNSVTGLRRIVKAAVYSWQGLRSAWQHEAAFRQESVGVLIAIMVAFWLNVDTTTRILLIGSAFLVLIVEIINSAIEALTDRISEEFHPLAGRAKDMGSAAVLLTIILAILVWAMSIWSMLK